VVTLLLLKGFGAANTKERKYLKQDPYTIDNTVLKIAKKRALIDAVLLVASLSEVFTQDIEDMDLKGNQLPQNEQQRQQQSLTQTAMIQSARRRLRECMRWLRVMRSYVKDYEKVWL